MPFMRCSQSINVGGLLYGQRDAERCAADDARKANGTQSAHLLKQELVGSPGIAKFLPPDQQQQEDYPSKRCQAHHKSQIEKPGRIGMRTSGCWEEHEIPQNAANTEDTTNTAPPRPALPKTQTDRKHEPAEANHSGTGNGPV